MIIDKESFTTQHDIFNELAQYFDRLQAIAPNADPGSRLIAASNLMIAYRLEVMHYDRAELKAYRKLLKTED
jgi:hypothetical protein